MAKEFSYKVGVDPDKGIQGLKALQREAKNSLDDVNNELQDGEDNAKALAQAMRDMADKVEQRLKDTARASDALGKALGPELAARLGQNGIDKMVTDMTKAGLTFDQITKDADELADGIKRLEQAGNAVGQSVGQDFSKVEHAAGSANKEMDKSGSVVANFAGNAAQDLPGVSGAFGALNVAVGQFAEYATEGDIKMSALAKSALGLGAATAVFMLINKQMGELAATRAFNKERIQDFTKALRDGLSVSEAIVKTYKDAGKVEVHLLDSVVDITPALAQAGLTVEQFSQLVAGGKPKIEQWGKAMREAGVDGNLVGALVQSASGEVNKMAAAQKAAAAGAKVFGTAQENAAESTETLAEKAAKAEEAIRGQLDAALALIDSNLAVLDAQDSLTQAIEDYASTSDDATTKVDEKAQAERDAEKAALSLAAAAAKQAEDQAKANGQTLTASQVAQAQIDKLAEVANALDGGSPLRKNLIDYINELKSVPSTVSTELRLTGQEQQNNLKDRQQLAADGITINLTNRIEVGGKTVETIAQQIRLKDRQLR